MIEPLDGHGLVYRPAPAPEGDDPSELIAYGRQVRADAVTEAEQWMLEQGSSPWDIASIDLAGRARFAWWTDTAGFVQETHDGAALVVVVEVPVPDVLPAEPQAPEEIPAEEPAGDVVRQVRA